MAVIGKIRQYTGFLIFIIGASIVGFLIMDATNSQFSVLRGRKDYIGKVNGEKIGYNDFEKKVSENEKAYEAQLRGASLTDDMREGLRMRTWTDMVDDMVMGKVYDNVGINVTTDEMVELVSGDNVSPQISGAQAFRNPQTGQFDKTMVQMYLSRLDQDPEGVEPGTLKREWNNFEKQLKQQQFRSKYETIISKGLTPPSWMAEMSYYDQARTVDFQYVALPYNEINDNDVKVTDEDLKKYIDEHPAKFKQEEESRKVQYVVFPIVPSAADSAKTVKNLEERRAEFAAQKTVSDDSVFVKLYSQTPFDEVYYSSEKLISPIKDTLFTQPVGTLVGPYLEGNMYKIAKVSDRKQIADSVRLREIRISFNGVTTQEQQYARMRYMDSIFKMLDSNKIDFNSAVMLFSDDTLGRMTGGEAGWVRLDEKPKMANDVIFYRSERGRPLRFVDEQLNSWIIAVITDVKTSKTGVLATYLSEEISVGEQTQQDIASAASNFASNNQSAEKFAEAAKKANLQLRTAENVRKEDYSIYGLGSARKLVKWAFDAKKGEVSTPIVLNDKHIVALLDVIRAKGTPDVDAVRDAVKPEVLLEKKYEMLAKKITDAKGSSADDLGAKVGKPAMMAQQASFANPAVNGAYEPTVVATALATAQGKLSGPVKGRSGAYAVQTIAVTEPAKPTDLMMAVFQLKQRFMGKAQGAAEVHRKIAKIEDDRLDFQ
ncbi:MAG: SurA N-terminal domain-containing protein [Chitinophagales bacterium]